MCAVMDMSVTFPPSKKSHTCAATDLFVCVCILKEAVHEVYVVCVIALSALGLRRIQAITYSIHLQVTRRYSFGTGPL